MQAPKWWQTCAFYQIYPRSFADANGDGMGDFAGMTSKLDYLRDLGVGAIWLSPHYPSPFLDCGYDISDYTNVASEYGSLDDFVTFLNEAHARGIRIILDLVLNHTSDRHPWFVESRSSRDNPKRDWYVWRDGKEGRPPNNWVSGFGGSGWELDPATDQYYYHFFLKEQPDLNWRNPEVKRAMWEVVRFWLDLGVDGFRLDAIATIFEDPDLPDHTATRTQGELFRASLEAKSDDERQSLFKEYQKLMRYQIDQPGVHELMRGLRALVDEYSADLVLVGEEEDVAYYGAGDDELHLVFNFALMRTGRLTPEHIRENQILRLAALPEGAWPCNTLGNHDSPRVWTRYGDGVHNWELARLHAMLLLTLKGTPFLYNGEEIGMADLKLMDLSEMRDTMALTQYHTITQELGLPKEEGLKYAIATTRDRCRSPLQWSSAPNAGFSPPGVATWLPVNPNYAIGVNVEAQEVHPTSLLNFYRQMLAVRRASPALSAGTYKELAADSPDVLAFMRENGGVRLLIVLNFGSKSHDFRLRLDGKARMVLSTVPGRTGDADMAELSLAPFEGVILQA